MAFRLNINTLEIIKSDPDLWNAVNKALDIKPTSMSQTIARRNNPRLVEYKVLEAIGTYLGKTHNELIEEYDDSQKKDGTEIQKDSEFTEIRTSNIEPISEKCNNNHKNS
jgi:hypothetical protein